MNAPSSQSVKHPATSSLVRAGATQNRSIKLHCGQTWHVAMQSDVHGTRCTSSLVAFTSTFYTLVMQSGAALVSKSMFYQLSLPVHAGQLVSSALTNRFIWAVPSSSKVSPFMERSLHVESVCIDLERATWSSLYGALDCCISATLAQALWRWKGKFSHQTAQGLQQVSKACQC